MEALTAISNMVIIIVFCWWYWRKQELPFRKFYWHALAAKLSAGILLGIIYAATYTTSDTFSLFEWAKELSYEARRDFMWYLGYLWNGKHEGYFQGVDRTLFFVKLTSIFALITNDNYWVSSLYFSLLSFLAGWKLTKVIWKRIPELGIPAVIAILFFPSCVFWTSGIIKESMAMTALFFLSAVFLKFWMKRRVSVMEVAGCMLSILFVWKLKYYYIGLLAPLLMAAWITRRVAEWKKINRFSGELSIFTVILIVLLLSGALVHPNFSLQKIPQVLVSNNHLFMEASSPGKVVNYYQLEATWSSVIINSPWALVSGLFRPFIWEADSVLKVLTSFENVVLLVLVIISWRLVKNVGKSPHRLLIAAVLSYCLLLCIFLAIATPNFGTLVRYRIGFLPFLLLFLIHQPFLVRYLAKTFNVHLPHLSR
ncbi:MAG: hypothetical protein WAZ98_04240 [Cyclobacteriaceae bacterium]